MPCVFPVLSIKAAALARHLEAPARARGEGVAFLLGVVGSFVALAAALIVARAAGQAVGWGFQLQSPVVVAALALVMLAAGLNLSGVFEIGQSLQGLGAQTAARHSGLDRLRADRRTGGGRGRTLHRTLHGARHRLGAGPTARRGAGRCSSCSGAWGLAAPFTADLLHASACSGGCRRPGAWMEGLRKVLAFPMYAAAAWLAWVYAEQAGSEGPCPDCSRPRLRWPSPASAGVWPSARGASADAPGTSPLACNCQQP